MTQDTINTENKVANLGNVYFIDYDKMYHSPLNNRIYGEHEDVSQLKENILINGLQTPINVLKNESVDGEDKYEILSGNGRYDSLVSLFKENQVVKYQGKELGNKIPCLLHTPFKSEAEKIAYLLGGNVRKLRDKGQLKNAAIVAAEAYEYDKKNGLLKKGETKRKYVSARVGISERSVDKYLQDSEEEINKNEHRIQSVDSCIKSLNKAIEIINSIEIVEYGRSDRIIIEQKLEEVIVNAKSKKKEK